MHLKSLAQDAGSAVTRACAPRLCRKSAFGGTGILACPEFRLAMRIAAFLLLVLLAVSGARAEYIVLRSGQRLHVTGYQLLDDKYRLQLQGGWLDVQTADVVSIEPEEVFTPVPAQPPAAPAAAMSPYHELVAAAASRYGVDAELITSVIAVESNFDPKAVSRKNARGLMQLLPETAARFGVKDVFDPAENIDAGTRYLRDLLQLYNNDLTLTLAAYNAGPDNVQKYGRVPPFSETVSYVKRVKRNYEKGKSAAPPKTATPKTAATDPPPPSASATSPSPPAPTGPSSPQGKAPE
ncbi:MAG: lytic transglycosylase domain-containing protein [Acidobacteria bacterium]|nr:MAG: lytic transglycosylase domain-containing protein [Acidobacteriota bacterium]